MLINNKNILFIGPYRQKDGWGQAAKDYLYALSETNNNVHCQPIYMSNFIDNDISAELINLENNHLPNYDIVIQNVLPMMISKTPLYNIGLLYVENQNFNSTSIYNLNLMDEIWVSSKLEKQSLISGGVDVPIKVIGHAIKTETSNKSNDLIFGNLVKDNYKFYFIGEYTQRKNIKDLVIAFHLEFDITEKVSLVLKLSGSNDESIQKDLNDIKTKLRTKKYFNDELLITNRLTDNQMTELHNKCDCFVITSYGEAFCRPAAEALCHGNYLISSSNIGVLDYVEKEDADIVDCYPIPVILNNPETMAYLDIYNANETWYAPNISELRAKMRLAFENKKNNKKNKNLYIEKFSYKNIGQNICSHMQ